MNNLFTLTAFTITLILLPYYSSAHCHIDDWTGLKALYESTNGENWINRGGWDVFIANQNSPPENCNLSDLYGVEVLFDRVWRLDLSGNGLNGSMPPELGMISYLAILRLDNNHLCGIIPAALGNLPFLVQLYLNNNVLSGCYSFNLAQLCDQLESFSILGGDNAIVEWEEFCTTTINTCFPGETYSITVSTNYSDIVDITATYGQSEEFILANNCVELMHYPACNNGDCEVINHFNNTTANEVSWATEQSALLFGSLSNYTIPQLKSFTHSNYNNQLNAAVLNYTTHTIYYGIGDSIERYSMTSPDIIGRTYTHYLAQQSDEILTNFSSYSESGALKESFADIFGEMIEYSVYNENDWVIGSQVMASPSGLAGIRSLSNPSDGNMQFQLPDTYKGEHWLNANLTCELEGENLCTKTNNGVQNHWFYLLAEGGTGINDKGEAYTINGIGETLATELAFETFNTLKPNAIYYDAVINSINAAKENFADNPEVATQTANAWKAVGLDIDEVSVLNNSIAWRLGNYQINGVSEFTDSNGITMMPRHMDLVIDSLGQDIIADQLVITMQIPPNYLDFKIDSIYPPLTAEQLNIVYNENEVTVYVNRQNIGAAKTNYTPTIPSGSALFRVGVCIDVIDIGVVNNDQTLSVVKYQQNTINGVKPEYLFVVENTNDSNSLTLSNKLINQDCLALGNIETTIVNSLNIATPPYSFRLYNSEGNLITASPSQNNNSFTFYNLYEGEFNLLVEDSNNKSMGFNFTVKFEARSNGSDCCPDNLFVPSGNVDGMFNATNKIEINTNTTITSGKFYICN